MKKTIQEIMTQMYTELVEAAKCLSDGLECPKGSLTVAFDIIGKAATELTASTCSQNWKPCLIDQSIWCPCKDSALDTDIIGTCEICHNDILAPEVDHTPGKFSLIHKTCLH